MFLNLENIFLQYRKLFRKYIHIENKLLMKYISLTREIISMGGQKEAEF